MSKGAISFEENDEYFTPKWLVEKFGSFDYDPATTKDKADELGIKEYDTIETDGLVANWTGHKKIWINPPFTMKKEFLRKAQDYYNATGGGVYMLLPISFLTTKTFHDICSGAKVYLPNGRIKFESSRGDTKSPAFGSVVIKLADEWSLETIKI